MIDIIWNIFQHKKIEQALFKNKLQDEKHKSHFNDAQRFSARLQDLERRHEQLKLVTLAMWSLLRDHSGLMESDLRKYIEEIDLMDGKLDGKVASRKEKVVCRSCNRSILNTSVACPYCGVRTNAKPFDLA